MLQTCCATRCWAHNVIWNEICVAWLVWKLWVVAKEMRALAKRAKGDIAHQFSWCGGRLCLLSVATWYANASCRIWMILKPVLSCPTRNSRNVLDIWCHAIGSDVSSPQHLHLKRFERASDNSSWDFVADASARKSELAISKTKKWTRCHVTW